MVRITKIIAREIIDSRGNPTVEAEAHTQDMFARACAPSGASTGKHEALELRDGGARFGGKGVIKACENVNKLVSKRLTNRDFSSFEQIDAEMISLDGTPNKSRLGANATTAVSLACAKLLAGAEGQSLFEYLGGSILPVPMMNVINGGVHSGSGLSIQEFMIMPYGAKSFSESLKIGCEIYHQLGKSLKQKFGPSAKNIGDEGGYAPPLKNTEEAIETMEAAIQELGYEKEVGIALDAASNSFYDAASKKYLIDGHALPPDRLAEFYESLANKHRIVSIEDPFEEEDFASFSRLKKAIGKKVQIVGDDLLVTQVSRIDKAMGLDCANALLLKVNQVGTLSESIEAAKKCYRSGWGVIVSHRSGETEDTSIAEISVGIESGQIKTGAPARSE
ncbi:phosphopyruvate hydratase, partial [Candidatus Parvarchaeota archaeon]|nr:phosphopyruvate hydratase [Candidatus Parvarchaeota archaeon]